MKKQYRTTHNAINVIDIKSIESKHLELREIGKYYSILIPKTRYLRNCAKNIFKDIEITSESIVSCFVSLNIKGGELFNHYTEKLPLLDTKGKSYRKYRKKLDKAMETLKNSIPNYVGEDEEVTCVNVRISTTISYIDSIKNWNIKPEIDTVKYKDFTLFTANNLNKPCIQQCIEFLGGKYIKGKSLEEQIPQNKIMYYMPKLSKIEWVSSLNDFITSNDEEAATNDCKNVARIVKSQGHMGIITEINFKKYRKSKIQKRRPLNVIEKDNHEEVFFDIESFTDIKTKMQVPYLLCWSFKNKINREINVGCEIKFVNKLIQLNKNIIVYAWYGSGYDYQYLITTLNKKCKSSKYIIKNNMIHFAEFITEKDKMITLKDPFLFLLTSLDKASKAFNVTNKGSFPHNIINCIKDLNNIPTDWPTYSRKLNEKFSEKYHVSNNLYISNKEINNKTIMEKAIEYCEIDVKAMKEVWKKFKYLLKENLGLVVDRKTFTLSQLSMKLMESCFPKNVELYVPNKDEYLFIKNAIFGGRVIAKNGIYNEDILYADVVSLYPSAMRLLKHGYGKPYKCKEINWSKQGIYKVKLVHKENKKPSNYLEFIPRRLENGHLTWEWFKEHTGTYHTYDLLIAKEEGYIINFIEGIEYPHSGYIFNNFIDKLFTLKEEHSNCNCKEQPCPIRMIAKIALNGGGYGKFVQKPIDKEVYLVQKDTIATYCESIKTDKVVIGDLVVNKPKFFDLDCKEYDKMVIEDDRDPVYSTQNGVSILSGSRYRLYKLCKDFDGLKIVYSDTDSIFVRACTVDREKFEKACGTKLGQLDNSLDDDNIIHKMIVAGPKMYCYCYGDKIKMYCKGVPKSMLTINQFKYLIESKENIINYEFEILRRKLVNIETRSIIKEIKQT